MDQIDNYLMRSVKLGEYDCPDLYVSTATPNVVTH